MQMQVVVWQCVGVGVGLRGCGGRPAPVRSFQQAHVPSGAGNEPADTWVTSRRGEGKRGAAGCRDWPAVCVLWVSSAAVGGGWHARFLLRHARSLLHSDPRSCHASVSKAPAGGGGHIPVAQA